MLGFDADLVGDKVTDSRPPLFVSPIAYLANDIEYQRRNIENVACRKHCVLGSRGNDSNPPIMRSRVSMIEDSKKTAEQIARSLSFFG